MRFNLGLLFSLLCLLEGGADLDLQVFDRVHDLFALLSSEVGGLCLQSRNFSLGVGERLVYGGLNGNSEPAHLVDAVIRQRLNTLHEKVRRIVHFVDELVA